jgi:hypothetical protein
MVDRGDSAHQSELSRLIHSKISIIGQVIRTSNLRAARKR